MEPSTHLNPIEQHDRDLAMHTQKGNIGLA